MRVNIYIRKEDEATWEAMEDKPKFIHDALAGKKSSTSPSVNISPSAIADTSVGSVGKMPQVIKATSKLCKHGYPLGNRMCKYGCK